MPKETEADRIVRERRLQEEKQAKKRQSEAARRVKNQRREYIRKIIEEIPRVLQLLATLEYPGMEELYVDVKTSFPVNWFKPTVWRIKAGWYLGGYERPYYDGSQTWRFYLLSDGFICIHAGSEFPPYGGSARLPQELNDGDLSLVLAGLGKLCQELEAKLSK